MLKKEITRLFKRVIALFGETFYLKSIKVCHCLDNALHTAHSLSSCMHTQKIFSSIYKYYDVSKIVIFFCVGNVLIFILNISFACLAYTCRNARVICFLSNEICACVFYSRILTSSFDNYNIFLQFISDIFMLHVYVKPIGNLFYIDVAIIKGKQLHQTYLGRTIYLTFIGTYWYFCYTLYILVSELPRPESFSFFFLETHLSIKFNH